MERRSHGPGYETTCQSDKEARSDIQRIDPRKKRLIVIDHYESAQCTQTTRQMREEQQTSLQFAPPKRQMYAGRWPLRPNFFQRGLQLQYGYEADEDQTRAAR